MCVLGTAFRAFLGEEAPKEHSKIPMVHPEAKKEQTGVNQGRTNHAWNGFLFFPKVDEEVEVVVLCEHAVAKITEVSEQVVDKRLFRGWLEAGLCSG